jgi:hypothetical protein
MPTYKNISQESVSGIFTTEYFHRTVLPQKTVETYRYYDNENLEKTSDEPYFNPVLSLTNLILDDAADSEEIVILEDCKKLEILNTSDNLLYLYLQSIENTPPMIISAGMSFDFEDLFRRFTKIILKASGTISLNTVFISQLSKKEFIY